MKTCALSLLHRGVAESAYHLYRGYCAATGGKKRFADRFIAGNWPQIYRSVTRPVWVHAASVGEVRGILPLLSELSEFGQIVGSTTSETGLVEFQKHVTYAGLMPFDAPSVMCEHFKSLQPRLLIINETELWPAMLATASDCNVPVAIVNARISDKSFPRYQKLKVLTRQMLSSVTLVLAQTAKDAQRFISLGMEPDRVQVVGSTKYDIGSALVSAQQRASARIEVGLEANAPCLIAGSVRKGEYQQVIDAYLKAKASIASLQLIVAPRHPEYYQEVAQHLGSLGIEFVRRSSQNSQHQSVTARQEPCPVLLLDTLGELSRMYALADVAFVGGTLVEVGGHNPLEASAAGLPVILGPHTQNVEELAEQLKTEGAAFLVNSSTELAEQLLKLLSSSTCYEEARSAALAVCQQHRGAVARLRKELSAMVDNAQELSNKRRQAAGS